MGVRHQFYIGVYVRCACQPVDTVIGHAFECLACKKRLSTPAHFCPTCGMKTEQQPVVGKRKPISATSVAGEDLGERLYAFGANSSDEFTDFDVYCPNVGWAGQPRRDAGSEFVGEARIKDSDPPTERALFQMAFESEIRRLRKAYGEQNVEVRWGALGAWA